MKWINKHLSFILTNKRKTHKQSHIPWRGDPSSPFYIISNPNSDIFSHTTPHHTDHEFFSVTTFLRSPFNLTDSVKFRAPNLIFNHGGQVQHEESSCQADSPRGQRDAIKPFRWFHEPSSRGSFLPFYPSPILGFFNLISNYANLINIVFDWFQENIFEWQFAIRGPRETEFEGGIYHGRIQLPAEYPFKPPSFMLLTVRY